MAALQLRFLADQEIDFPFLQQGNVLWNQIVADNLWVTQSVLKQVAARCTLEFVTKTPPTSHD